MLLLFLLHGFVAFSAAWVRCRWALSTRAHVAKSRCAVRVEAKIKIHLVRCCSLSHASACVKKLVSPYR